tara:strand:- start:1136 stop:1885 length:750 start_codon:yes stop_codon:yes gene_type:complete
MSNYEKVEIKSDEAPAYQQEQVEQFESQAPPEAQEQVGEERPSWLPEKFESPEALAYAYNQLQKEFSQSRQQPQEAEPTQENTGQITEDVFYELSEEFDATGDVSEESRERLAQSGIPRAMIDNYVNSQKVVAEQVVQQTFESVGGEENYNAMLSWASQNLPDQEIDAFNDLVNADQATMRMAVNGMYARFVQAQGVPLLQGETGNTIPNSGAFQSRAQVVEAMSDPRYKKDPAYRQQVYNRLQNSNVI